MSSQPRNDADARGPVRLTLPDGSVREFPGPITGKELAAAVGPRLAKAALALRIDGKVVDLATRIDRDAEVAILTRESPEALEIIRHDAAHALAEAAKELYPEVQVTFGPATENGFYYDFYRETPFTPEDLARLEARMREIVGRDEPITREVWSRDEAVRFFTAQGERFKAEWIGEIPADEPISVYRQGKFVDLCTGPHLPSTGKLGAAFKLMKVAGAYWRGDPKNPQLQRVYGTAWRDEKELAAYLTMLEEAEKRDHRRLGRELHLFHQQEEAVGSVFWHPKGWTLWRTVENYLRGRLQASGYVEVKTPQLLDRALWEASGHWEKFRENMFIAESADEKVLALKPMNCPGHVQIFRTGLRSYRDLPLRMAEFGSCHRNEPSGALHGIMRVRAFTQDDAHIFCREDQVTSESIAFCDLLRSVYLDFGFEDVRVKFSDRPPVRAGSDETWDKAEQGLKAAVEAAGMPYTLNPGEGAFYGPKLEFVLRDAIGRDWQCGTLQLDFVLPERLDASYIGEDGQRHRPVMLHRAIFGSMERFLGILIENYAGRFPMWLAPVQAVVASITSDANAYADEVLALCKASGLRAEADVGPEKITYKVREHSLQKVPVILVVGRREAENRTVALRRLGGETQEVLALDAAVARLVEEARGPAGGGGGASPLGWGGRAPCRNEGADHIARPPLNFTPTRSGPRVNEEIGVPRVRLIDARGNMVGIVSRNEALERAAEAGLDLVEIAGNADPPVCKILDYGKYKYEEQKKKNEARKKQKIIEVKEIKLRPGIDDHDYEVKMRAMRNFIEEGDKVKITMRFRGRELAHQDLGMNVLMRVRSDLDEIAKVEQFPKMEGKQMTMVMSPK